jgi:5-methylcytosine-specific restriction endonuclease McrA
MNTVDAAACKQCGDPVVFQNDIAARLATYRGVICSKCRADSSQKDSYQNYLNSAEWRVKSERVKRKAGHRCQVCNSPHNLHAHHRTYENKGNEPDSDLIALCRECHQLFHEKRDLYIEPVKPFVIPDDLKGIIKR